MRSLSKSEEFQDQSSELPLLPGGRQGNANATGNLGLKGRQPDEPPNREASKVYTLRHRNSLLASLMARSKSTGATLTLKSARDASFFKNSWSASSVPIVRI